MNYYHVTFFYLATGMEGHADVRDYGYIEARDEQMAKITVTNEICKGQSHESKQFFMGCLTAEEAIPGPHYGQIARKVKAYAEDLARGVFLNDYDDVRIPLMLRDFIGQWHGYAHEPSLHTKGMKAYKEKLLKLQGQSS